MFEAGRAERRRGACVVAAVVPYLDLLVTVHLEEEVRLAGFDAVAVGGRTGARVDPELQREVLRGFCAEVGDGEFASRLD